MVALTGKTPANTFKDLLQVSNTNSGVDATLRDVSDGEGTASSMKISTVAASFSGTVAITGVVSLTAAMTAGGDVTGLTLNATGDTAAGDGAAMGFTAAEGLILTGQGSTNDITIKNDADATIMAVLTGTINANFGGDVTAEGTVEATGALGSGVSLSESAGGRLELRSAGGVETYTQYTESGVGFRGVTGFAAASKDYIIRLGASNISTGTEVLNINGTSFAATFGGNIDAVAGGINLGATGAANLLNDYEEGTFTCVVADATTAGNVASITTGNSTYTKIGDLVTVFIRLDGIDTTGMTSGNELWFRDLPFTSESSGAGTRGFGGGCNLNLIDFTGFVTPRLLQAATIFRLYDSKTGAATTSLLVSAVNSSSSNIEITLSYKT